MAFNQLQHGDAAHQPPFGGSMGEIDQGAEYQSEEKVLNARGEVVARLREVAEYRVSHRTANHFRPALALMRKFSCEPTGLEDRRASRLLSFR